jgi:hypothetical protein
MVLTAYFALSPVIGLSCHRRLRKCIRKLDAGVEASGPHDFTVRVSTFRQARCRVHRIPFPTSVTIAIRPSSGNETAGVVDVMGQSEREIFLQIGLDYPNHVDPVQQIALRAQAADQHNWPRNYLLMPFDGSHAIALNGSG